MTKMDPNTKIRIQTPYEPVRHTVKFDQFHFKITFNNLKLR
jgi:hypothetical protein